MADTRPIQEHPDYHLGFYDAAELEPLFSGASAEYEAGWRGYWTAHQALEALQCAS